MKVLMFAASLRRESLNKKLIRQAKELLPSGHEIILKEFNDYMMPLYNGDVEVDSGIPDGAQRFIQDIADVQAVIISSPEYNFGIPGTLKNAIDWSSRVNPTPWAGKQVFLMGASTGMVGTNRGLWQIRQPLEALSAFVYPDMFGLANANKAFDEKGALKDEKLFSQLKKLLGKFADYAEYASRFEPKAAEAATPKTEKSQAGSDADKEPLKPAPTKEDDKLQGEEGLNIAP